jgi:hypothetical protein
MLANEVAPEISAGRRLFMQRGWHRKEFLDTVVDFILVVYNECLKARGAFQSVEFAELKNACSTTGDQFLSYLTLPVTEDEAAWQETFEDSLKYLIDDFELVCAEDETWSGDLHAWQLESENALANFSSESPSATQLFTAAGEELHLNSDENRELMVHALNEAGREPASIVALVPQWVGLQPIPQNVPRRPPGMYAREGYVGKLLDWGHLNRRPFKILLAGLFSTNADLLDTLLVNVIANNCYDRTNLVSRIESFLSKGKMVESYTKMYRAKAPQAATEEADPFAIRVPRYDARALMHRSEIFNKQRLKSIQNGWNRKLFQNSMVIGAKHLVDVISRGHGVFQTLDVQHANFLQLHVQKSKVFPKLL